MNAEQITGRWHQVKGWGLESWGRIISDRWLQIEGRRERLLGRLEVSLAESRLLASKTIARAREHAQRR